jgi:HSP20 family protein
MLFAQTMEEKAMTRITRYTPSRWLPTGSRHDVDFGFMWPVTRLQQEMNRLFSDAFRGLEEGGEEGGRSFEFNPVVDVEQHDDQYEITVELPGVIGEDVNVEVSDDMLVVSGSKERKQTRGEGENRQSERIYGSFQRAFRLPDDALREDIEAHFADGVLTLRIPRDASKRQPASRRIEVRRGAPAGEREQKPAQDKQPDRPPATH